MKAIVYNTGMSTQDTLNIFLIFGLFVTVACFVYLTYYFVQALKSFSSLVDNLDETTQGIKEKLQMKALAAIPALIVALAAKVIKKRRG